MKRKDHPLEQKPKKRKTVPTTTTTARNKLRSSSNPKPRIEQQSSTKKQNNPKLKSSASSSSMLLRKKSVKKASKKSKKKQKQSMTQVVLRFRPLLHGEKNLIKGVPLDESESKSLKLTAYAYGREKTTKYSGYSKIFSEKCNNDEVYNFCINPRVGKEDFGQFCIFGYGHSGSGKTHTLFGYEEKGLFQKTIDQLLGTVSNNENYFLNVTAAEIHLEEIYDLLSKKKKKKCHLRDDGTGNMVIRSETMLDKSKNLLRVESLVGKKILKVEDANKVLKLVVKRRSTGLSCVHNQSSRSHAILAIEITNNEILDIREKRIQEETNVLPFEMMLNDMLTHKKKHYKKVKGQKVPYRSLELKSIIAGRKNKIRELAKKEKLLNRKWKKIFKYHGNTVVFIDLAGADYETATDKLDKKTQNESIQINIGLLALKECISALNKKQQHVPFRNSKLTIALKKYLLKECHVIMLATASPALEQYNGTINTLRYSQMFSK